jgi:translation initiation factor IF-2
VLEAIQYEVKKFENEKVAVRIVYSGVGDISEGDVKNASGNKQTLILGFNTKVDASARAQAERLEISIQTFDIIYKLTEWLEDVVKERTPKSLVEEEKGRAKILKAFSKAKDKQILGGRVEAGALNVGDDVKIFRREAEIGQGKVRELQQAKSKTSEVLEGLEFGSMIESKIEIAPGDIVRAMSMVER